VEWTEELDEFLFRWGLDIDISILNTVDFILKGVTAGGSK